MSIDKAIRQAIQKILGRFGYQVIRMPPSLTRAFAVQRELVKMKEPVIFDIGAHTGRVTEAYRRLFPLATIHCFEPFPESFHALARSVQRDPRTSCHNIALSEKEGTAILNVNPSPATNSLLPTDERAALFWGEGLLETRSQIEVKTTTVDLFCLEAGITHIDILKMDVQGAEFSVLEGATRMLARRAISLIYTELITGPAYEGQYKLHEYLSFLDSAGYDLLDFFNPVRSHDRLMAVDAIFLSREMKLKPIDAAGGVTAGSPRTQC
jgi:FkbM family methyltransferase